VKLSKSNQAGQPEGLTITMDKTTLDIPMICRFLQSDAYWAGGRSEETIKKSIENSICFGVYLEGRQIGFARAVTDMAVVFYLADFFILPAYQRTGIGGRLMDYILACSELQDMRGILTTQTAHGFYQKFGFRRDNDIVRRRIMVRP
jgi:GNAT superfamily N-acetyltransferase